jgi:hypothetical protein
MEEASALANKVGIMAKRMLCAYNNGSIMLEYNGVLWVQLSAQQILYQLDMRHTKCTFLVVIARISRKHNK